IERILYELSAEAGSFSDSIRQNFETAVELNLIFAKAHLAYRMKASRPQLNDRGDILLKQARHPLLDPQQVVPTDIALGGEFDTLVITGPNTGGKTVTIKTIGLMTLMAMCGLLLPVADGSRISIFDRVLADIGDEQSIEQSLSTFSGHMTNIISIMAQADENSLILIDELGAGTDPVEGAALATAILEFLRERGAKIAATTHYAELKAYALQTPGVINGSCEFDVKTLRPTYKLLIGMPGRSNAFAISRRLGMDEGVVDRANSLISEEHRSFESVVAQMEQSRQSMEASRAEAQRLSAEAAQRSREAREAQSRMAQERERELERARGEARRIIDAAKRQSQALLEELDAVRRDMAKGATSDQLRRAKSAVKSGLNRAEDAIAPVQALKADDGPYQLPRPVRAGDRVLVTGLNQEGEVVAPADKNGNVEVQAGLIKTRVKESTLRLLEGGRKKQKPTGRSVQTSSSRATSSVSSRCDLRGRTVEEALMELDFFLDSAVMDGLGEITIIHGKGTGALRSAVQDHLRRHQQVDSYRLGTFGEGENGVTIATLK
ncbi:MAG: Smr/MutS family protein, partial [Clostridiales bacterium]|nr:Smr/MutS family protein [Clostridiales bacterium]